MLEQGDIEFRDGYRLSAVLRGVALALSGIEDATFSISPERISLYEEDNAAQVMLSVLPAARVKVPLGHDGTSYEYGFQATVYALVQALAGGGQTLKGVNILPGVVSPEDGRCLKELVAAFGVTPLALPDFSAWVSAAGDGLPGHGTPPADIPRMGRARATLEFGRLRYTPSTPGQWLREQYQIPCYRLPLPVGIAGTDKLCKVLEKLTDRPVPKPYRLARRQLGEAYAADRRLLAGQQVVLYGEGAMMSALTSFLYEVDMEPQLCASEAKSGQLAEIVHFGTPDLAPPMMVLEGVEFSRVALLIKRIAPRLLIGSLALLPLARELGLPFLPAGFPFAEAQPTYLGYSGTLYLFERMVELLRR